MPETGTVVIVVAVVIAVVIVGVVIIYFAVQKPPAGGTFADVGRSLSKGIERGPRYQRALRAKNNDGTDKVVKTCQEEFGNTETDPKKKQFGFWSAEGDACYTCPPGYLVNAFADMKKNKCTDPIKTIFDPARDSPATYKRKGLGPAGLTAPDTTKGEFSDGSAIWVCPANTSRNTSNYDNKADGPHACVGDCSKMYQAIPEYVQGGTLLTSLETNKMFAERLKHVTNPDYKRGVTESVDDYAARINKGLVTTFEPNIPQPNLKAAFLDILKDTCWSCPEGHGRSLAAVYEDNACVA